MNVKESPMKIGLIGIGVIAVIGSWAYDYLKPVPVAPTAGLTDITAIIMQLAGIVSMLLGVFADMKKAVPPEVIAAIQKMIAGKKLDVGELAAIISGKYGKIDINALLEIIKKLKDLQMPKDDSGGNVIEVEDEKQDDETLLRHLLSECTKIKGNLKVDVQRDGKQSMSYEVKDIVAK